MDPRLLIRYKSNDLTLRLYCISKLNRRPKHWFNLEKYSNSECLRLFRFTKEEIKNLRRLLQIPFSLSCSNGTFCDGVEALCILLRRLAYPNRYIDLVFLFHRSQAAIGVICNKLIDLLHLKFGHLLTDLGHQWLANDQLQVYADAISSKGSPLRHCWGFIDGTVRSICRPSKYQKECYNGHKRTHALKYQSVVIPNGLIANLYGPVEGRRHDAYLLSQSQLLPKLAEKNEGLPNPFYLYGDPAYPLRTELQGPFKGSYLSPDQQLFNKKMSMSRITVEWAFGKIISLWAFNDYKKNQRLFLQAVGKYFRVAALLTNVHTCMYGNQISDFFNLNPPNVNDYLIPQN